MTPKSVLGVLAVCWVGSANPPQLKAAPPVGFRAAVLGVLGLSRPRACVRIACPQSLRSLIRANEFPYMRE